MLFKVNKEKVMYYPSPPFRPGIPVVARPINFIFINGGMGDYICWMQAILWMVDHARWIQGTVIGPAYFRELADYWLKGTHWRYGTYEILQDDENVKGAPCRGPMKLEHESLNATGAHLLDCGFAYYACQNPVPEGWNHYPKFGPLELPKKDLPERYAIVTTGKTSPSRHVPDAYWNLIIDHVIARGFTPVFLGSSDMNVSAGATNIKIDNVRTSFGEGVRYDKGIDLRDKTTLLEAAAIIHGAEFVVGHDNGLLHLAGCTETPIVFGYNVASPLHRRPRRERGAIYDVTLTSKELACIHCQSNTNFVLGHIFHECFYKTNGKQQGYKENECIDIMFADGARRWKEQIDKCIEEHCK